MSNLAAIREQAINIAKQACEEDRKENYPQALQLYEKAIKLFMHVIRYDTNPKLVETLRGKTSEYLDRAEKIRDFLKGPSEEEKKKAVPTGSSSNGDGKKDEEEKDENAKLKDGLSSAIVTEKPNVKWDDVAGLEGAKGSLQEAVILPTKFPQLFVGKRRPWKGILLYGPPGTGKSYLAKACATEAEGTFFSVSSSDLVSKWMGESERLVRSLFEMARANKPAIIFIDEIDSLCGSRSDGENDSSRRIKTEFLVQMQGVGHDDQGILVLGATNIPWGLDSAIRRRFERRIYIPLPDERARAYMFKLHTGDTPCNISDDQWNELGTLAEGYSGSDISVVVRDALMEPVRKCQSATHFKQVTEDGKQMWEPCPPSSPGAKAMKLIDIPGDQLKVPLIEYEDFVKVLETSRPSVSQDDLHEHEQFTKDFGQEG